ncbi:MAG: sigma-70 family RNA polymerase sigma factor [Nitrospiraceae bacterium]|nr:sigma-70 family RNA polymerase sigma factor [Nitrospiraceae bacterium]
MSEWEQQDDAVTVRELELEENGREHEGNETSRRDAASPGGPDVIMFYLRDIRKTRLLTFEEEQKLAKRVGQGDEEARARMIEANLRLVIVIGKRYINRGLPFPDIIEEGNFGLIRAVDKFQYQRGFRFSTYAWWWIKQSIERAIVNQVRIIRLPVHVSEIVSKYTRTVKKLTHQLGREPDTEEIAAKMKISADKVRAVSQVVRDVYSLETPISDQEGDTLKDVLSDDNEPSPLNSYDDGRRQKHINEWLSQLPGTERKVIELRYGLNREEPRTLVHIGKQFGLTRERIRQIESEALKKLKSLTKSRNVALNDLL